MGSLFITLIMGSGCCLCRTAASNESIVHLGAIKGSTRSSGRMIINREYRSTRREFYPAVILSTTHPMWTTLGAKESCGLRNQRFAAYVADLSFLYGV